MTTRSQINVRSDNEIDGMIDDIKQDFFNKNQVDLTTSQLILKLIYDAWDKIDPSIKQKNR